ncbi:MAG: 3'(2'),5'-bisphosphate nucleotidase CysQ [Alphaproteobacteria bacterium]|nr:3'(2'),5'-bisphosphate nucleotidase CysQ [Alphaproteobacteria bacterium]
MIDAAREAGAVARARFGTPVDVRNKADSSPVTEVDLEVNRLLAARLRPARPDYGWLSEEDADDGDRLTKSHVFIVDPIDGTRAFIDGAPEFCISIGLAKGGRAHAGVVYNPITEELFAGGETVAATLNGAQVRASDRDVLEGAHLVGKTMLYGSSWWPEPWPDLELTFVQSLAFRMSLVASGRCDGAVLPGFKHEWDIAAGAAILAAAGGTASDPWGAPLAFNAADPRAPGVVVSGPRLHGALLARTRSMPHPSTWQTARPQPAKQESS